MAWGQFHNTGPLHTVTWAYGAVLRETTVVTDCLCMKMQEKDIQRPIGETGFLARLLSIIRGTTKVIKATQQHYNPY